MEAVLIALVIVPFAVLALVAWRSYTHARVHRERVVSLEARETFVLRAVRSFIEASRVSSDAVIERLAETLHLHDPRIDAFLAFAPTGEELECVYAHGPRVEHYSRVRLRRDANEFLPARAALAGHRATATMDEGMMIPTDRRALAVPMHDESGLRAVIYVSSSDGAALATEDTIVRTIEHAVSPYAVALEREADRADATYDGLTGLLTPRAFRARLHDEITRARLGARGILTLWFIDTDHFKNVNDTHGHAAGDVVLQGMADLLRLHAVPDVDVVGRNGGDEFCALIFDAQKTVAIERAQSLCEAVRRHEFGMPVAITASIGVASFPYDARSSSELLEVADAAMYHSKRSGRDRVSFAVDGTNFTVYR